MITNKNQLISVGFFFHMLAAIFSIGYHQCDELFQVFEFAGYKLGLNSPSDLPWEFGEKMRSGIQPLIAYIVTRLFNFISINNPFTVAMVLRVFQGALSFYAMVSLLKLFEREITSEKLKLRLWQGGLLFWFLPYFHVRFSSESFSATLFVLGFICFFKALFKQPGLAKFFYAGIFFGLSFVCRFQIVFMIAGFYAWVLLINKPGSRIVLVSFAGILLAIIAGMVADRWLYGVWTFSSWNYLDLNLFRDKASGFGRQPFYFYITEALLQLIPPFSLLIVAAIVGFWITFKRHVITWITLPFILLHFFVPHKELRFLFPVINFLPFMLVLFYQAGRMPEWLRLLLNNRSMVRFVSVINILLLIVFALKPADDTTIVLNKIYEKVEGNSPVLLYESKDPYNNQASLNYFRKKSVTTCKVDSVAISDRALYYLSEKFDTADFVMKKGVRFEKIYSSFPSWIRHLNFNGWMERSFAFSIYKAEPHS